MKPFLVSALSLALLGCGGGRGTLGGQPDGGRAGATAGTGAAGGLDGSAGTTGTGGVAGTGGVGAGVAGMAGVGGIAGTGGSSPGTAGTTYMPPFPGETCGGPGPSPSPLCGAAACGNGKRDTCDVPYLGFCPMASYKATEECDGLEFGDDSCGRRGYGSGAITCRADCTANADACRECMPPGGPLVACKDAPFVTPWPGAVDLAASNDGYGLAWTGLEDMDNDKGTLTFERLSPALERLGTTALEDKAHTATPLPYRSIMGTAVVALVSGWVVAVVGEPDVFFHAVDAQGTDFGRVTVEQVEPSHFGVHPWIAMAPRANGGPLLVWASEKIARVALLAADGRSATPLFDLPLDGLIVTSRPSAVFAGDAFYVIFQVFNLNTMFEGFRLVRVGTDGLASKVADIVPEGFAAFPMFVAGASDLRLIYDGTAPGGVPGEDQVILWRRLGFGGDFVSPAVVLARPPLYLNPSPAVALGDDTAVLLGGMDWHALGMARVAGDGKIVTPAAQIARTRFGIETYALARRGNEVVAAWNASTTKAGRIGLARLTP
jgi:hypothetical protein